MWCTLTLFVFAETCSTFPSHFLDQFKADIILCGDVGTTGGEYACPANHYIIIMLHHRITIYGNNRYDRPHKKIAYSKYYKYIQYEVSYSVDPALQIMM